MIIDEAEEDNRSHPRGGLGRWLRSRRVRVGSAAALLVLLLLVALDSAVYGLIPAAIECREVTQLTKHPTDPVFTGASLGPLLLRDFAPSETRAVISTYHEGFPEQVRLIAARPYDHDLSLSGWRCLDRRPLRFSLAYPFSTSSQPIPPSAFALAGQSSAFIRAFPVLPDSGVVGPQPPWFLFESTGRWVLELRDGDAVVGRATIEVQAAH